MQAFHNDPAIKQFFLDRIAAHAAADAIVKGHYWKDGKGCAIGCTYHGSDHAAAEREAGIPLMLAHLEDRIFEGLPNHLAVTWPRRFMEAIRPGADLSAVGPKFLLWLIRDSRIPGIDHPTVAPAIQQVVAALNTWVDTGIPDIEAAEAAGGAAARAAMEADAAAWATADAAASDAAASRAGAARAAALAAEAAGGAARAEAAWAAAWAARAAVAAWAARARAARVGARAAAYQCQSEKLLELLAEA